MTGTKLTASWFRLRRAGPWIAGVVMMGMFLLGSSAWAVDVPESMAGATHVGSETCSDCHSDLADSMAVGFHGNILDFQSPVTGYTGCEACHGPGSLHADSEEPEHILNPATADGLLSTALCLDCHRNDGQVGYEMSIHALSDVSCAACHTVHGEQRQGLPKADQRDLCVECHRDVEASLYLPSHHPVKEGKMLCTDCHDPHRDQWDTHLAGERATDMCLNCHSSMQGPYIYEHPPVIEDCATCHAPHGAVANNLLKQNEPFLCLQCHQAHFHTTLEGIEGEFTSLDGYTETSTRDGSKRGMLTKCTQCHTEVHGSDLPSQSISGQGRSLTR